MLQWNRIATTMMRRLLSRSIFAEDSKSTHRLMFIDDAYHRRRIKKSMKFFSRYEERTIGLMVQKMQQGKDIRESFHQSL